MKHFNHYLFAFILVAGLITSCGKNGAVGPTGQTGPAGPTGATGSVGATGADGTKIYSGTGAPASSIGATGDFYINTSTSDLYGPKTSSGWGSATSLKGSTGAAGAAGSKIYSGTGVPASSLGSNGDYYLDPTNYLFYGPKASGVWALPINLKGPKGDPGTANVIYSDWITPSTYTKTTTFGTIYFTADIAASAITQSILDKGSVLVYGKLDGYNPIIWPTEQVSLMPIVITYMDGANANIDTWSALDTLGSIRISLTSSLNAYGGISNAHQFRYVIIPGAVHTLGSINTNNYADVKKALHMNN